jgi:hypothetical protein
MTPQADALIKSNFPNLRDDEYEVTSPQTHEYNCVAWAAEDTENWWWPSVDDHWPDGVPLVNTVDNFTLAFQRLGYEVCDDGTFEPQYERVALYANANGPQHMARQLASGAWTSKLGSEWDIQHPTAHAVEGDAYGEVVVYLRRPRTFEHE